MIVITEHIFLQVEIGSLPYNTALSIKRQTALHSFGPFKDSYEIYKSPEIGEEDKHLSIGLIGLSARTVNAVSGCRSRDQVQTLNHWNRLPILDA